MKPPMHRGFSLLELLVALFVVVIITSLVSLAVNSGGQEIQLEAKVNELQMLHASICALGIASSVALGRVVGADITTPCQPGVNEIAGCEGVVA